MEKTRMEWGNRLNNDLMNLTNLQTPYADTDAKANTAKVVPTNNGAASSR